MEIFPFFKDFNHHVETNRRLKYKSIYQSTYNLCHRVEEYVVHDLIPNSWHFLCGPKVEILPFSLEDRVQSLIG